MDTSCLSPSVNTDAEFTASDGCRIAYRLEGDADKPVLMFSNSIGTSLHMWDMQIQALLPHFRILRYDMRGHGCSDVPKGDYSMERFGKDALELLDVLGLSKVHFCGLSLGGMVGQWIGIHAPERLIRLVLCNTSSFLGPVEQWDKRIKDVLQADASETASMFLHYWFPTPILETENKNVTPIKEGLLSMNPYGFAGSYAAVRDMDFRQSVASISVPTLVIGGRHDTVTLPEHSELLAETIPDATLKLLPAVHLSNIERPAEFLEALLEFLL